MDRMHAVLAAVERTYQAALDDSSWADALSHMTRALGAPCGMLVDASARTVLQASIGLDRESATLIGQELAQNCPAWIRTLPVAVPTRQTTRISDSDFEHSDLYQRCIRKVDGFYGMIVPLPQRDRTPRYFVAGRLRGQPDFDAEDVRLATYMVPHLLTALSVRTRLDAAAIASRNVYDALTRVQVGVILLDANLRPVFVNAHAEALAAPGDGLLLSREGVSASYPREAERLQAAIARTILAGDAHDPGSACCLTRHPPSPPLKVMPVQYHAAQSGGPATARIMLLITEGKTTPGTSGLTWTQYRFTPRETALAELLAAGASVHDAADRLDIGIETARTHLKHLFGKTDTCRQSELVCALLGVPR